MTIKTNCFVLMTSLIISVESTNSHVLSPHNINNQGIPCIIKTKQNLTTSIKCLNALLTFYSKIHQYMMLKLTLKL